MDDIQYPNDLTSEQVQALVESIQDCFGGNFTRAAFTNHLLALLEDVSGFETGDIPASLIESAWEAYGERGDRL